MNAHPPITPARFYLGIWAALMVLLFVTWGVAQHNLGKWNIVAAMTVAVLKMLLVILFFMHVRHSSRLTWIFVAAGFFWLFIMFTLVMGDYMTRGDFKPQ
jgi:cytochrome c oxidase subunit IV